MKWVVGLLLFLHTSSVAQKPNLVLPVGHTSSISSAVYSPDGKYIVTASWDNTAKIWQAPEGRLLRELKGHTASLTSAFFSPNGKYIVTTSKDSTARIWETSTGNFLNTLKSHVDWVAAGSFSTDGKYVVTASWDNTAIIWETATARLQHKLSAHTGAVNDAHFSPDGKYLVTASKDSTAKVWQTSNGQLLYAVKHNDWVNTASFSSDGKHIITASKDGTAKLWVTNNGNLHSTLKGHSGGVNTAVVSIDNKYILTASEDSTARLWEAAKGQLIYKFRNHNDAVNAAFFSANGKYIVTASADNVARVWQTKNGELLNELKGHSGPINVACFSPDEKYILTASADNTSKIWNLQGALIGELRGHTSVVTSATYSLDGKYMVTASWDNTAKLWDGLDGKLLSDLQGHTDWINSAAFSSDGNYVVTASSDNTARIWSVPDGKLLHELKAHADWVSSAVFSSDEKYIVTTSWDNTAKLWLVTNGQMIAEMKGHTAMVNSAVFSAGNKKIVTSSWDNTARVWDVLTGKELVELKAHTDKVRTAAFSPDAKYILTSSWDSTAKLWDAESGRLMHELKGHNGSLNAAFFSSDGKQIVTTSMDNTARIWNASNGHLMFELKGHTNSVTSAHFSPDEKFLVTVSWDNTARIWNAADGKLLKELKGHTSSLKSASYSPDGKFIVTTSEDNTLKKWDAQSGEFLYTFFAVDSNGYLAIDKDGRYDGTEDARKLLYYVCENEIVDLEQFKDLSWEPGLVNKLTGLNHEPITAKKIDEINICNYTPEVKERGFYNGAYHYQIKPRQGGIGEVQVFVNNKLIEKYNASSLPKQNNIYQLAINEKKLSNFFVSGINNQIWVKATTRGGTMSSRGNLVTVAHVKKPVSNPNIYVLAVGVSQYKAEKLNLRYAAKDAADFSSLITLSAQKLLNTDGRQHVFTYVVNTEPGNARWPAKTVIQKLVDTIAQKATPDDILVVFFAGHGILQSGQKYFYLLTAEATRFELDGIEKEVAISTEELKEWLRKIKANKQILILDACNSGRVVQNFQEFIGKRDVPADQQRALESLKDKTGTFILCASASGQSAYETSLYGQGLLTYSLLSGVKLGGGLKDNKYIDVTQWFNYASDHVKVLAKEIGGRQDPQLIGNASFEIGLVDKEVIDNIQLPLKKKIFRRSKFIQDEELLNDEIDLSYLTDKELNNLSVKGASSPLIFVADNTLLDDYSIRGRYTITENKILLNASIFKGQKERVYQFELTGSTDKKEDLARRIVDRVQLFLKQ